MREEAGVSRASIASPYLGPVLVSQKLFLLDKCSKDNYLDQFCVVAIVPLDTSITHSIIDLSINHRPLYWPKLRQNS